MLLNFRPEIVETQNQHGRLATITKLYKKTNDMTDDEMNLLIQIVTLIDGRPDRRDFAQSWSGSVRDLPAALARI